MRSADRVPAGGREAWPRRTSVSALPYSSTCGSTQPSTYLLQAPMCVGMDWNSGPECEPVCIRSQNSTSVSPTPVES